MRIEAPRYETALPGTVLARGAVFIDIVKKQLYISVTNSTHGKVERNGMRFISSKQGVHGFGLLRIDSIVAKYGGFLNRQSENNVFATEVLLPLQNDALDKDV